MHACLLSQLKVKRNKLATDLISMICDKLKIGFLAKIEDALHLCILALIVVPLILLHFRHDSLEDIADRIVIFALVAHIEEKLLDFGSKYASSEDVEIREAD